MAWAFAVRSNQACDAARSRQEARSEETMASRQLDAYRTSGPSPTTTKRHNFRNEHRAAYNRWRNNREYCEEQAFYIHVDPKTRKARRYAKPKQVGDSEQAAAQRQAKEDAQLRRYIREVEAGRWPQQEVSIAGEQHRVLADSMVFARRGVTSYERTRARMEANGETGDDSNLLMRPIWEADTMKADTQTGDTETWADEDGWRPAEYDPADAWVERLDHRDKKIARLQKALCIHDEARRSRELDRLLNACSLPGEDPGFASLLLEWVCDREPGYQLHCVAQNARIHQRGRHKTTPTKLPQKPCNLFNAEPYVVEGGDDPPPLAIPA